MLNRSLILLFCVSGCTGSRSTETPPSEPLDLTEAGMYQTDAEIVPPNRTETYAKIVLLDPIEPCAFPPKTDVSQAVVQVRIMVNPDGTPQHTEILAVSVHNHGFEDAARSCIRQFRFQPATDSSGTPVRDWTRPFRVTFAR